MGDSLRKASYVIGPILVVVAIIAFVVVLGFGFKDYQSKTPEQREADEKESCETLSHWMSVSEIPAHCLKHLK